MKKLLCVSCGVLLSLGSISSVQAKRKPIVTKKPAISVKVDNGTGTLSSVTPGSATLVYSFKKKGRKCLKADLELTTDGKFVSRVGGRKISRQKKSAKPCTNYPTAKLYPSSKLVANALSMCPRNVSTGKKRRTFTMKASAQLEATVCYEPKKRRSYIDYDKMPCRKFDDKDKEVKKRAFQYDVLVTCFMGLKKPNHTDSHRGGTLAPTKPTVRTKTTSGPQRKTTTPTRRKVR